VLTGYVGHPMRFDLEPVAPPLLTAEDTSHTHLGHGIQKASESRQLGIRFSEHLPGRRGGQHRLFQRQPVLGFPGPAQNQPVVDMQMCPDL
jgi:hypothetical protein